MPSERTEEFQREKAELIKPQKEKQPPKVDAISAQFREQLLQLNVTDISKFLISQALRREKTFTDIIGEPYYGNLETEQVSIEVQIRGLEMILALKKADQFTTDLTYVASWEQTESLDEETNPQNIQYEFVSKAFAQLLGCPPAKTAQLMRKMVVERIEYRYIGAQDQKAVTESSLSQANLTRERKKQRLAAEQEGRVEAIYKIQLPAKHEVIYLKDVAKIMHFKDDNVCLACGTLTDVTKEMEHQNLLKQMTLIDQLTGIYNRRILPDTLDGNIGKLQRELETREEEEDSPEPENDFTFIILDIDEFKKVNDTHGHPAGDDVLRELAEIMKKNKRSEDMIGRYGGEEFFAIIQGKPKAGQTFAERLRQSVEKHAFIYEGKQIPLTITLGLASGTELMSKADLPLTPDKIIDVADKRLYLGKQVLEKNIVVYSDNVTDY